MAEICYPTKEKIEFVTKNRRYLSSDDSYKVAVGPRCCNCGFTGLYKINDKLFCLSCENEEYRKYLFSCKWNSENNESKISKWIYEDILDFFKNKREN